MRARMKALTSVNRRLPGLSRLFWLCAIVLGQAHQQATCAWVTMLSTCRHQQPTCQQLPWFQHVPRLYMTSSSSDATTTDQLSIDDVIAELGGHQRDFEMKLAEATTVQQAEELRREYLGKKGPVKKVFGYMRLLSDEDKPKLGAVVNQVESAMEVAMSTRKETLTNAEIMAQMQAEAIDVTMPGVNRMADVGRRHPLSIVMEKAVGIFTELGYDTVTACEDSPEIETDYNCFEALNCPKDHPARDMQDTFYLSDDMEWMLRTHTSSVQIRQLAQRKPPLRMVAPGRVYRKDDIDATHSLMFHQVEILALEKRGELNLGHLKGTVEHFLKQMFGPNIDIRFRGSYFPFTEPSMEVDVFFNGKWLEVLGCGMVDPNVLEMAGIDPNEYGGFAAGFGVERFAMVIYGITDLREFYKNDKRFLEQFPFFYDDGNEQFLVGNKADATSPNDDPRGETVPSPPVDSWEELAQQRQEVNGESSAQHDTGNEAEPPRQSTKQSTPPPPATDIDISKLDIRVGVITKAWAHPEADKLYCEEVDVGEDAPRQIASGLRAHYELDELINRKALVLCNLKARKMMGFASHGMVLCAVKDDSVRLVEPPADAAIGERVVVEGFDGDPATENQVVKKKMLETIFPDLCTDGDGAATYQGKALSTSEGLCRSTLLNAEIS